MIENAFVTVLQQIGEMKRAIRASVDREPVAVLARANRALRPGLNTHMLQEMHKLKVDIAFDASIRESEYGRTSVFSSLEMSGV